MLARAPTSIPAVLLVAAALGLAGPGRGGVRDLRDAFLRELVAAALNPLLSLLSDTLLTTPTLDQLPGPHAPTLSESPSTAAPQGPYRRAAADGAGVNQRGSSAWARTAAPARARRPAESRVPASAHPPTPAGGHDDADVVQPESHLATLLSVYVLAGLLVGLGGWMSVGRRRRRRVGVDAAAGMRGGRGVAVWVQLVGMVRLRRCS
jgi:hypothetical protein